VTRILLIDDDARLRRTCATLLRAENFEVLEAPDGKAGVQLALRDRPEVIVCDVNMPGMNGHAVLTALRSDETTLRTPFIFLTGEGEMTDLREGMNLGADDYLIKPIDPEQLLTSIRVRLKRAESNASLPQIAPAAPDQLLCLGLTPREAEVLFWVAQGKTNPEIAVITSVQLTTVKKHLESIFQKTGVENRTSAAALALEKLGPFT
jgi:DNA-binding NarL/FixJ family response regulator